MVATLIKTIDLYCCTTTNDGDFFRVHSLKPDRVRFGG